MELLSKMPSISKRCYFFYFQSVFEEKKKGEGINNAVQKYTLLSGPDEEDLPPPPPFLNIKVRRFKKAQSKDRNYLLASLSSTCTSNN